MDFPKWNNIVKMVEGADGEGKASHAQYIFYFVIVAVIVVPKSPTSCVIPAGHCLIIVSNSLSALLSFFLPSLILVSSSFVSLATPSFF